jgi:hypothetical protein
VLTFLHALEAAVHRDPNLQDALRVWMTRGQPYVLQQVLALAHEPDGKAKKRKKR